MAIDSYQIAIRILLAAILSGVIGYERELHGRAAGLRTTILVGVGSCLIMITSMNIYEIYRGLAPVDPSRIAAQVVSGIGFLGAGTILRFRASVRGLTTAAGLWAVAGVGLAVGSGFYSAAFISSTVIFIVLFSLSHLERKIKKDVYKVLELEAKGGISKLCDIRKILADFEAEIKDMEIRSIDSQDRFSLSMQVKLYTTHSDTQIIELLSKVPGVNITRWV